MEYISARCDLGYHDTCNDNFMECDCCNCYCHDVNGYLYNVVIKKG